MQAVCADGCFHRLCDRRRTARREVDVVADNAFQNKTVLAARDVTCADIEFFALCADTVKGNIPAVSGDGNFVGRTQPDFFVKGDDKDIFAFIIDNIACDFRRFNVGVVSPHLNIFYGSFAAGQGVFAAVLTVITCVVGEFALCDSNVVDSRLNFAKRRPGCDGIVHSARSA